MASLGGTRSRIWQVTWWVSVRLLTSLTCRWQRPSSCGQLSLILTNSGSIISLDISLSSRMGALKHRSGPESRRVWRVWNGVWLDILGVQHSGPAPAAWLRPFVSSFVLYTSRRPRRLEFAPPGGLKSSRITTTSESWCLTVAGWWMNQWSSCLSWTRRHSFSGKQGALFSSNRLNTSKQIYNTRHLCSGFSGGSRIRKWVSSLRDWLHPTQLLFADTQLPPPRLKLDEVP